MKGAVKTPTPTLAESLIELTVEQEIAVVAALQAGLQVVTHPGLAPRTDAELEDDHDNMPV